MLAGNRSHRIAGQILKEISHLLLTKVQDPRLKGVTLTDVRMTKDLMHASVYYSFFGQDEEKKQVQAGFESAKGFIRKEIGERLHLRYVPDIQFKFDISLESGQRMERLLEKIGPH